MMIEPWQRTRSKLSAKDRLKTKLRTATTIATSRFTVGGALRKNPPKPISLAKPERRQP